MSLSKVLAVGPTPVRLLLRGKGQWRWRGRTKTHQMKSLMWGGAVFDLVNTFQRGHGVLEDEHTKNWPIFVHPHALPFVYRNEERGEGG